MVAAPYYHPQHAVGPTRSYPHQHVVSGRKHCYQSTNYHLYHDGYPSNPIHAPHKRVALFDSTLPKDQTDLRVRLFQRLRDTSLLTHIPGGFPFRHVLDLGGKGKMKASYEPYDIRLTTQDFGPREIVGIMFKGPSSSLKQDQLWAAGSSSGSKYFNWQVYSAGHYKNSSRTILAQVRVDPSVMYTSYGKFIRTDPSVISRALAISLELGVLLTIVSADDTANSHSASNKLAKSVLTHRRRAVAPEYTQRWAKWLMAGPEYACGLYFMYPDEGDVPITEDSILYVGVTNHGTADIVYAYPNYA